MKLATLKDGTPDGRLVVVSHDLTRCSDARHVAPTLRAALDAWDEAAPRLELIARSLEAGGQPVERFHERDARAPLPRADGGRAFLDPRAPLPLRDECIALTAEFGVLGARGEVRLVMLAAVGPVATLAPVAVTPDELGKEARLRLELNGDPVDAALSADAAARLAAAAGGDPLVGCAAADGAPVVLRLGDTVRIEIRDASGHSIFGAIEHTAVPAPVAEAPDRLVAHFRAMARNNAWANDRLLEACEGLDAAAFAAPRTSFFPSLRATLNHSYGVDVYYLDLLEEKGQGLDPGPDLAEPAALRAAQAASDRRLIAFCDRLTAADLDRRVMVVRDPDGRPQERIDAILAHLFQHQIHHRGQAHAMLAGTGVPPPQLDEFFLDIDRHPSVTARGFAP